jgi:uncharacterized membrane protein
MEQLALGTDVLIHVAMGIALSACAGLRAFLPLFVVGLAGRLGWVPLSASFEWIAGWPALVVFGIAVAVELVGDKFPVVDHFLDSMQTIVKPIVGAMLMLSVVSDWAPLYLTLVWIILGGTLAGVVHLTKAKLRLASTVTTAGMGNPILSVTEDAGALIGTVAALFFPVVVALLVMLAIVVTWIALRRFLRRAAAPPQSA